REYSAEERGYGLLISALLPGVYAAESAVEALNYIEALKPGESIVTKEGVWFGHCWVRISKIQDETSGILQRKQALQEIQTNTHAYSIQLQTLEAELAGARQTLHQYEQKRERQQQQFREQSHLYSELNAKLSAKCALLEQLQQRQATLLQDLNQQQQQLEQS